MKRMDERIRVGRAVVGRRRLAVALTMALFGTSIPPAAASSLTREAVSQTFAAGSSLITSVAISKERVLLSLTKLGPLSPMLAGALQLLGGSLDVPASQGSRADRGRKARPEESKGDRQLQDSAIRITT